VSASLASDLAGAVERLLQAARAVERHLLAHGALVDPPDLREEADKFDSEGNLRKQGSGGGTPSATQLADAVAQVVDAHGALSAALSGSPPAPVAVPPPGEEA